MKQFICNSKDPQVIDIMSHMIENFTDKRTPDDTQAYDFVKGYDIAEVIDDTYDIFTKYNAMSNELKDFSFIPQHVYNHVGSDEGNAIRYQIIKRTASTMSQGSPPHEGTLQHKWMMYDIIDDLTAPGYKVIVYVKSFDNTVEFSSWSKNYRDSFKGAEFVENILETYGTLLKVKGLQQLRYLGRGLDQFREMGTYTLYGVPIRYYFRTHQIKLVYEKTLETLIIETVIKPK